MIGIFSKNMLKFGRIQAINTGKYNAVNLMNMSLIKNTPRNYMRMTKSEPALEIPQDIAKYDAEFKLDESVTNPVHDLVKAGKEKTIGLWLLLTAAGVFGMIVLGGYTRLSKSGLSMTSWKPIDYKLPGSVEEWEKEFTNYKKYPEYQLANKNMDLEGFKKIFFVEWAHRLWGSSLGFLFGVPLLAFASLGWLKKPMMLRLTGMLGFGGLQGLIGWWMVRSGFEKKPDYQNRPRVSVYRLFTHLNMAIILYSFLVWNGLTLVRKPQQQALQLSHLSGNKSMRALGIGLLHFIALNIMSGAIVAGIDAGKGFNTWPDMNGQMIPDGLMKRTPWYQNFFENRVLVQFNHRNFAYLTTGWTAYMFYKSIGLNLARHQRLSIYMLSAMVLFQVASGINTLLLGAPVRKASEHQSSALITLTVALYTLHSFRKPSKKYFSYVQTFIKSRYTS